MCLQATDQLSYGGPHSLFTPLDFAGACGLGVKQRSTVSLMGDRGFGMTTSTSHASPS